MKFFVLSLFILLVFSSVRAESYLAPVDLDWAGDQLLVTTGAGRQVLVFDTASSEVNRRIEFPVELTGSVVSPDGRTLYVTGGGAQGQVFVVDTASGDILKVIPVGHTPNAPVLSPDGEVLYVCNRFNHDVSIIDLKRAVETSRVCVAREPVAADISKDGRWLYVGNHLPNGRADTGYIASEVSVIDTQTGLVKSIPLVNGAEGLRGLKVSPDGQTVFAVHYLARYQVPITQLERGWVSTDALSVIRVSDQTLLGTVLLDDLSLGFPNPWAIDFTADGENMLVTAAGSHELSVLQLPELMQKIEANPAQIESANEVKTYNNLSFLSDIRQRVRLSGNGPRGSRFGAMRSMSPIIFRIRSMSSI